MADLQALTKEIDSNRFHAVYLCSGANRYLLEKFLCRLKEKIFAGKGLDFNFETLDSQTRKVSDIIDCANQLPVFSDKRLVIVENFKLPKAQDQEIFLDYVKNPSPTTVLAVHFEDEKQCSKIAKAAGKSAKEVKFKDPYDNQLPGYIAEIASNYGKKLEPGVIEYFTAFVGNNLKNIDTEISKLASFAGERKSLSLEDVNSLVSDTRVETVFSFVDSVSSRDLAGGLKMLDKIMRSGEMPVRIITMLARHYRILWKIKRGLKKGMRGGALAGYCGVSPYFLQKYVENSKNFTAGSLVKVIGCLAKADLELKTLNIPKRLLVEKLCIDLTSI